jgi:hypothetical protein
MKAKLVSELVVKKQKSVLVVRTDVKAGPPMIVRREN